MNVRFLAVVLAAAVCTPRPAAQPAAPPATQPAAAAVLDALSILAGRWSGELTYRDYRSGERVAIPARVVVEPAPDRSYVTRRIAFSDPGKTVHAMDLLSAGADGKLASTFVQGTSVEHASYTVADVERRDRGFRVVLTTAGTDGGEAVSIRVTAAFDGRTWSATKEVRPVASDGEWSFRNELRVKRAKPDAGALIGAWSVDLRPEPEAAPYLQKLVVDAVEGATVTGSFYDTGFTDGRVDTKWGEVRLAFVTEDGSGTYHTSAVLRGDELVGTTHSIGRGFLSRWTARRTR